MKTSRTYFPRVSFLLKFKLPKSESVRMDTLARQINSKKVIIAYFISANVLTLPLSQSSVLVLM